MAEAYLSRPLSINLKITGKAKTFSSFIEKYIRMVAMLLPLLFGACILKFGKHPLHLYPLGNPIKTFTIFNFRRHSLIFNLIVKPFLNRSFTKKMLFKQNIIFYRICS